MRYALAIILALLVTAASTTPAVAAPVRTSSARAATLGTPTHQNCNDSLRGMLLGAPDNDIKQEWDYLESTYHYDITSSYSHDNYEAVYGPADNGNGRAEHWIFWRANGSYVYRYFMCWFENDIYHDQYYLSR
jgi:hypothetical protein